MIEAPWDTVPSPVCLHYWWQSERLHDCGLYIGCSTNMSSFGGISGIQHGSRTMFLTGVYTDGTELASGGPPILDFTSDGFASVAPLLNQAFFIGDGLTGTGSGSVQHFAIPTGAARLFLGFADGFNFAVHMGAMATTAGL
ncbi:MAG: hypothetical protein LW645_08015 [Verrucomicrobiaceae bacterium]|nr:hypothetical protein [Verrucomicrobiaceae bacterium]